jgi:hypothetical protein
LVTVTTVCVERLPGATFTVTEPPEWGGVLGLQWIRVPGGKEEQVVIIVPDGAISKMVT